MTQSLKVGLVLLAVIAVVTVLVTPDPSDDVQGVLHHLGKVQKLVAIAFLLSKPFFRLLQRITAPAGDLSSVPHDVVSLLCARLC